MNAVPQVHDLSQSRPRKVGIFVTANAMLALGIAGIVIRLFGFEALHWVVQRVPSSSKMPLPEAGLMLEDVRCALNRAASYRVTPAMCLRRASAAVFLLRPRGIQANLVIGIQRFPFEAHAWAEVNGRVVTEPDGWVNPYRVIATF